MQRSRPRKDTTGGISRSQVRRGNAAKAVQHLQDVTATTDPADAQLAKRSDRETVVTLRIPRELHEHLKTLGGERGFASEVRRRLEQSLATSSGPVSPVTDLWFSDVLTAIGHAAGGAGKLKERPAMPPGTWERDGQRRSYDVRKLGQDVTAYEAFAAAVHTLLEAFAPDGVVSVSPDTGLRLADQLVALALGALGDRGLDAFARVQQLSSDPDKPRSSHNQDRTEV